LLIWKDNRLRRIRGLSMDEVILRTMVVKRREGIHGVADLFLFRFAGSSLSVLDQDQLTGKSRLKFPSFDGAARPSNLGRRCSVTHGSAQDKRRLFDPLLGYPNQ
jgi:hypothetical protein